MTPVGGHEAAEGRSHAAGAAAEGRTPGAGARTEGRSSGAGAAAEEHGHAAAEGRDPAAGAAAEGHGHAATEGRDPAVGAAAEGHGHAATEGRDPAAGAAAEEHDPAADGEVLEARGLDAGYPGRTVLGSLSLAVPKRRLTCLLGPNGSGKTTLLRTLTGMLAPLRGHVRLLGDDLTRLPALERARRLAVVLTGTVDAGLLRAADLVALGRYPHTGWGGRLRPADRDTVDWALSVTGAEALADRGVATLSDGERQRVLIARALAQEPAVLALDEPTAFVDLPRRAELAELLGHLARECGLAVLMTTHDLDLALRTADDVWLLEPEAADGREGARVRTGGPEDLALSGAVGRAFASAEVTFDLERGRFVPRAAPLGLAEGVGDGARAAWARRAVERAGWGLASPGEPAALSVRVRADGWEAASDAGTRGFSRLADLAEHARALLPRSIGVSRDRHRSALDRP